MMKALTQEDVAAAASRILRKITDGAIVDGSTVRSIYRPGWQGLGRDEVVAALTHLEQRGWLRVQEIRKDIGRPSKIVRLRVAVKTVAE